MHLRLNLSLKFKIENFRRGFTLIELIIVIAIVGILTAMVLVNIGKNDDRDVRLEAERLVTFLREVQNMAFTVEQVVSSEKMCGVGIHLVESTENPIYLQPFYVYAKSGGDINNKLDVNCRDDSLVARTYDNQIDGSEAPNSSVGNFGDKFYFRNNVEFDVASSQSDIFFLIPHGEVYYGGKAINETDSPNILPDKAELTIKKGNIAISVSVGEAGKISY